jgi:hypothetical protein
VTALVGHELRVPLASALMYLGIARRQAEALSARDDLAWTLSVTASELQRVDRLISRVIELEERGRAVVRPRLIDLVAVVNRTVADTLAVQPHLRSSISVSDGGPMIGWWDDMAVEEIVRNLLSNAIRFGEAQPIRINVEPVTRGARIVVKDHGQGIAAFERRRIFERGVRAAPGRGGGLGLGLWLVRELVRAHGGRATVKSTLGQGATFTVTLCERPPDDASRRATLGDSHPANAVTSPDLSANRLLVFARDLLRAESFGELLKVAQEEVRAAAGYGHVWFLMADGERADELRLIDFAGSNRDIVWKVAPVLKVEGDRFLEELVASNSPVVIADARVDERTNKAIVEQLRNRTLINIPLRLGERRLGVFGMGTFGDEGCRVPSQRELDYLVGMAGQIAVATGRIQFLADRSEPQPITA